MTDKKNVKRILIVKGFGIVLRHQAERYKWIEKIFDSSEIYILSEEKLRDERFAPEAYLKYIGNMTPIQSVVLDKNNIDQFLNHDIAKFDIIMEQGEHYPLILLINKFAKKHGVITIDVHQANDWYSGYFNQTLKKRIIGYIYLCWRFFRSQGLRDMFRIIMKYSSPLLLYVIRNYTKEGYRFYPGISEDYRFNKCFVIGRRYKRYYKLMGYRDEDVIIIGDYELNLMDKFEGKSYAQGNPYVVYIDSTIANKYSFYDDLNSLAQKLKGIDHDLFFYPHPNLNEDFIGSLDPIVNIIQKRDIERYFNNASYFILHNSNMIHYMVYYRKRFALVYSQNMVNETYYNLQYKKSQELKIPHIDIANYDELIQVIRESQFNHEVYNNYLNEYLGGREVYEKGKGHDNILIENVSKLIGEKANDY